MFLRYETKNLAVERGLPTGFLVAAHYINDNVDLSPLDKIWLEAWLSFFDMNLKVPHVLKDNKYPTGICWFKSNSFLIEKTRPIISFLTKKGIHIETVSSINPGTIIYEDDHQVVCQ